MLSTVAATGTVVSPGDVGVSFASTGTVTTIKVAVGDKVRKGQILATIDDLTARQQLACAARLSSRNAESQLATAEGTQTPSPEGSGDARACRRRQSQVDSAQRNLSYTRSSNALNARATTGQRQPGAERVRRRRQRPEDRLRRRLLARPARGQADHHPGAPAAAARPS